MEEWGQKHHEAAFLHLRMPGSKGSIGLGEWQAIKPKAKLHLLPEASLYLPKVSQPPKTASGDKVFKHINPEEIFISRPHTPYHPFSEQQPKTTLEI